MTERKRRQPTPGFKLPHPYNPMTGQYADLGKKGPSPVVALMQVIEEDTYDNYLVCRGFDPETRKFYDSINVAKPYGVRGDNAYEVGRVISCAKSQTQLGTNPGRAETTVGHPEDLDEAIVLLYADDGVSPIEWLETGGSGGAPMKWGKLDAQMDGDDPDGTVTVSIWDWNSGETDWEDTGDNQDDVYPPLLLAAGKTLASGTRVLIAKVGGKWYVINAAC